MMEMRIFVSSMRSRNSEREGFRMLERRAVGLIWRLACDPPTVGVHVGDDVCSVQ